MPDPIAIAELDDRIAILRDNIRELTELAAAQSGAADESLNSDRIAALEAQLAELVKRRDIAEGRGEDRGNKKDSREGGNVLSRPSAPCQRPDLA